VTVASVNAPTMRRLDPPSARDRWRLRRCNSRIDRRFVGSAARATSRAALLARSSSFIQQTPRLKSLSQAFPTLVERCLYGPLGYPKQFRYGRDWEIVEVMEGDHL